MIVTAVVAIIAAVAADAELVVRVSHFPNNRLVNQFKVGAWCLPLIIIKDGSIT